MVAVDTNILVYYHRAENRFHQAARKLILGLHEGGDPWAIPYPCVSEFLAIVTHPRIFTPATPMKEAMKELLYLSESPNLYFLAEGRRYLESLEKTVAHANIAGGKVHDARIVAIALEHNISTLYSLDRDFSRFQGLRVVNPFGG